MAKGVRELFIQSLKDAGFSDDEAESLVAAWTKGIRPVVVGLLDDIVVAIREEWAEWQAPLTNETTKTQFQVARELFVVDRFVYLFTEHCTCLELFFYHFAHEFHCTCLKLFFYVFYSC